MRDRASAVGGDGHHKTRMPRSTSWSTGTSSARTFLLGVVLGWCLHYVFYSASDVLLSLSGSVHHHQGTGGSSSFGNRSSLLDSVNRTRHPEALHHAVHRAERAGDDGRDGADSDDPDHSGTDDPEASAYGTNRSHSNSTPPPIKDFTQLVRESGSDKYSRHHYERYYTPWLEPYRHAPGLKILEVGARGGHSLTLWDKYFTNASLILGLAYRDGTDELPERLVGMTHNVSLHFGDQSKVNTMQALLEYGPFDVIIDDASHVPQHVVFTPFSLWERAVKPGGLYVVEDLETSYWWNGSSIYGYPLVETGIGAKPEHSVVTKLEQIQQVLIRHQIGARNLNNIMPGDEELCSVEWGMNLMALRKCDDSKFVKPALLGAMYDGDQMDAWIAEARRTNPTLYLGDTTVPEAEAAAPDEPDAAQNETEAE